MPDLDRVKHQAERFAAALPGWADTIEQAIRRRDLAALRQALAAVQQTAAHADMTDIAARARELEIQLEPGIDLAAANEAVEQLLALSWRAVSSP